MVDLENIAAREATIKRIQDLPLEVYIEKFAKKYHEDSNFRKGVHKSLNLSTRKKMGLVFAKTFMHKTYEKETNELITTYATNIREKTLQLYVAIQEQKNSKQTEQQLDATKQQLDAASSEHIKANEDLKAAAAKKEEEERKIAAEYETKIQEEKDKKAKAEEELRLKTDAERLAKEKLKEYLQRNESLKFEGDRVEFNEPALMKKLEDMFLKEVVADIDKQGGKSLGFLARVKKEYERVITHLGEMDDYDEMGEMDLIESIINARSRGYRVPCRVDHYITGKEGPKKKFVMGKISIPTRTAIDYSGSMAEYNKYIAAQKVGGATGALMRKLSQGNKHDIAIYSSSLTPVTFAELMKNNSPGGGTATHLALDWLYDGLKDSGASIANLLTDGCPDSVEACVESAKKFKNNPYIQLKIFLIGNDAGALNNIKAIGKAAGSSTKVIPVSMDNIAAGVISNFEDSIRKIYSIDEL
jgi:hypothetical protein